MSDPKPGDIWRDREGLEWTVVSFDRYVGGEWRLEVKHETTTMTVRDRGDLLEQGTLRLYFKEPT